MRDMLEPTFGESGAVVAQFFIAVIALLILVGLVYWVFRRFGGLRFGGIGRGRIPRLAITDALSIGSRHKLVLVRRDNVEHLILIGRTANLVVESSIVRSAQAIARVRQAQAPQPQHQPAAAAAAASPGIATAPPPQPASQTTAITQPRAETTGISEPIPFPQAAQLYPDAQIGEAEVGEPRQNDTAAPRMAAQPRSEAEAAVPTVEPVAADTAPPDTSQTDTAPADTASQISAPGSAHFEEPTRISEIEPVVSPAIEPDEIADEPIMTTNMAEFTEPEHHQEVTPPAADASAIADAEPESGAEATIEVEPQQAPAVVLDDSPEDSDSAEASDAKSAAKVSDLEHEMVRLLGEITAKRDD